MDFREEFGGLIPHAETFMHNIGYKEQVKENKEVLAEKHLYLIDKCLATKRTDLVSENELRALGKIALYSYANDAFYSFGFANNVMKKMEKMMNIAIAEAAFLKESAQNQTKGDICTEFTSIYERFP